MEKIKAEKCKSCDRKLFKRESIAKGQCKFCRAKEVEPLNNLQVNYPNIDNYSDMNDYLGI